MLRAILWAEAHVSHPESRRLQPREDSLQPRRRKVNESAHLVGRNRLAAYTRWTGSGAG